MADRWTEERERDWRGRRDWDDRERRAGAYGRDEDYRGRQGYGSAGTWDYGFGDYGAGTYQERSFEPRGYERDRDRDRGPVFGERETGADYTGPRYGAGGYYGYGQSRSRDDGGYGERSYGDRNYSTGGYGRGGRYYGDTGRERIGRSEYESSSTYGPRGYGSSERGSQRYGQDRGYDTERAYRAAYGPEHGEHAGHREAGERGYGRDWERDRDRDEGRSFWERASHRVASWFGEGDEGRRDYRGETHRGRGPQGWKRSDDRITEEVHERLTDDPWIDASSITITVSGGEVTLSGTVDDRNAKHRAERIVEDLSGVSHVQNNLRVSQNPLTTAGRGYGDSASAAQMASGTRSTTTTGKTGRTTN